MTAIAFACKQQINYGGVKNLITNYANVQNTKQHLCKFLKFQSCFFVAIAKANGNNFPDLYHHIFGTICDFAAETV